ncbi:MAG: HAMP domain-containing protein [Solirubrobacterales bacterium]|nr:HAMP domain-containing protein [Solirubrobacterales bacterium]
MSIVSWALRVALVWLLVLIVYPVGRTGLALTLVVVSAIALVVMAPVSMLLEWLIAGRVLRPLRTLTITTREISATNLHQRLALDGPDDELKELSDTIDALLDRLQTSFESQRLFVANASHELRTPLSTLRATLDVALAKPNVHPQVQRLDAKLREDLDQADRLLEDFLTLARAQHGQLGEQASLSLTRLTHDALAARAEAIAAKRLELYTALIPLQVTGAETLLARMVENVIENAIRHNHPDGFISVACGNEGEIARLVVESGGPVLDSSAVADLALPFRRLGTDRTGSQNGHGLGLSIVAAVAAAHDGALELHARAEGGLRVQITLPAAAHARAAAVSA